MMGILETIRDFWVGSTFKKEIKASDLGLEIVNDEPVFSALVCYQLRINKIDEENSSEKGYTNKDIEKILALKERENDWWKVDIGKEWVTLRYFPRIAQKHHDSRLLPEIMRKENKKRKQEEYYSLDSAAEFFTSMVKYLHFPYGRRKR